MTDLSTYAHHMECILRVLIYIEERFDQPLSLEEMAKIAKISPYYFHRLFHAYVGVTVTEYAKQLRVDRARERLQYSDAAITEIALDVGYETPSSFNKVFQQVMGQSPREYRKQMQPIVREIMARTALPQVPLQPEYVTRKNEMVLFVRRIGNYREAPWRAFEALIHFLKNEGKMAKVKAFYSMALDDPQIAEPNKYRFDACVALMDNTPPHGEVGQKTIPGGRFAVFLHRGPYTELDETFGKIFTGWYPNANVRFASTDPFCEYLDISPSIPDHERETKLYIPLKDTV